MNRMLMLVSLSLLFILQGCIVAPTQPDWSEFTSEEGRFSIQMPGKPTEKKSPVGGVEAHSFSGNTKNEAVEVVYADFPADIELTPGEIESLFDESISQRIRASGATVLSTEKITLQNYPGREVKVKPSSGRGSSRIRMYIVRGRLYTLEYLIATDDIRPDSGDTFLDSFKLINP